MASILVVDDEEPIRFAFRLVLEDAGYSVDEAEDGVKALKALAARDYNLLITDIVMPNRDGIETILHLKQEKPDLPIIAISGGGKLGSETYLEMASMFNAEASLSKPVTSMELLAAVKRVLAAKSA